MSSKFIIYANGTDDPAPVVVLGGIDGESGTTGDLIVGEQFIGEESGGCLYTSRQ